MRWVLWSLILPAVAWADGFVKGPYLQDVVTDGVTVMWEGPAGRVIVSAAGQPDVTVDSGNAAEGDLHEVKVRGLEPGRRYAYRVETGAGQAGGELETAPRPDEPLSFVVYGDTRDNVDAHRAVVERVRREVPDFILMTGDLVDDGSNDDEWQTFFNVEGDLLRDNVLYPAVGNHDRQGSARTASTFRKWFSLPENSPDPERYYAFTFGNSRFLVLDSNAYSFSLTDQTAWLERELQEAVADPAIVHKFIVMHHPPYSTSIHGGEAELREMWTPIFERYGVDAVFSGHDHVYERSEKNGVRYFVSGGGGAPLYPQMPHPSAQDEEALVYFERTYNYLRVQIVGEFVEVTAMRDDGTLIESLSWGALPAKYVADSPVAAAVTPPVVVKKSAPSSGSGCEIGAGGSAWGTLLVGGWLWLRMRSSRS